MAPEVIVALIISATTLISTIIGSIVSIYNLRVSQGNHDIVKNTNVTTQLIKTQTDGMIDQIRQDAIANGMQAGIKAGIEIGKASDK